MRLIGLAWILCSGGAVWAHWPWIEPAQGGQAASVYFGVYPDVRMAPQLKGMMASGKFWEAGPDGKYAPVKPALAGDQIRVGTGRAQMMDYTLGVYAGHGAPTLVQYTIKAFSGAPVAGPAPETTHLEIVAMQDAAVVKGKAARFQLLRKGKPLAGATVHAYTAEEGKAHNAARAAAKASGHDHGGSEIPEKALTARTGADGGFALTFPKHGSYQLHVSVKEATPGTYEGKAYETVTAAATLCLSVR